jgi:hypothetical protein
MNEEIPRRQSEPEAYWPTFTAWSQQVITFFYDYWECTQSADLYDFDMAQELWWKLHYSLPRTKKFFCFYCMRIGIEEQLYKLPWKYDNDYHRKWTGTIEEHACKSMQHYMHRNCFRHWQQWMLYHGKFKALDCERFCPVCTTFAPKDFYKPSHEDGEIPSRYKITGVKFGLMVNRFYLDP